MQKIYIYIYIIFNIKEKMIKKARKKYWCVWRVCVWVPGGLNIRAGVWRRLLAVICILMEAAGAVEVHGSRPPPKRERELRGEVEGEGEKRRRTRRREREVVGRLKRMEG